MKFAGALLFAAATLAAAADCAEIQRRSIYTPVEAPLPAATLADARNEAQWILRSLCVEIDWVDGESADALLVRILPKPVTADPTPDALGLAMPNIGRGNRGAVFLDRIQEKVAESAGRISLPTLLGCVMAHEIGHLVLRTTTHSSKGIMSADFRKAELAKASQRQLTFTAAERRSIVKPSSAGSPPPGRPSSRRAN